MERKQNKKIVFRQENSASNFWNFNNKNIKEIDAGKMSCAEFIKRYEKPNKPVVITKLQTNWKASEKWALDQLKKDYGEEEFMVAGLENGTMKLNSYLSYMDGKTDYFPKYILDSSFVDHHRRKMLLEDYEVPEYFQDDLFKYAGTPYRWFMVGAERSGAGIRINPSGTSAWNALVVGFKRWCLFPPNTPDKLLKITQKQAGENQDDAATWFTVRYSGTRTKNWPKMYKPIEILQCPGDTVFVPPGYKHVVLNLTDTVAVTHNFCSKTNFPNVWRRFTKENRDLSEQWLCKLGSRERDVAAKVQDVNVDDDFNRTSSSSDPDTEMAKTTIDVGTTSSASNLRKKADDLVSLMEKLSGINDKTDIDEFYGDCQQFRGKIKAFVGFVNQYLLGVPMTTSKIDPIERNLKDINMYGGKLTYGHFSNKTCEKLNGVMNELISQIADSI